MISSLTSKCQHFKLRGLQFHPIKWLKNGHPNFISKESNIEKLVGVATLIPLFPPSGKLPF